ncbi:MAG: hypothetical protein C4345_08115, partial [Chloroflexota bacterium]
TGSPATSAKGAAALYLDIANLLDECAEEGFNLTSFGTGVGGHVFVDAIAGVDRGNCCRGVGCGLGSKPGLNNSGRGSWRSLLGAGQTSGCEGKATGADAADRGTAGERQCDERHVTCSM